MLRCRKGDVAILLRSATGRDGLLVEVGDYRGDVYAQNSQKILVSAWEIASHSYPSGRFCAQDDDLLPIRPEELKEEEERERELDKERELVE